MIIHLGDKPSFCTNSRNNRHCDKTEDTAEQLDLKHSVVKVNETEYQTQKQTFLTSTSQGPYPCKIPSHRSLMDIKIHTSNQCMATQRAMSCYLLVDSTRSFQEGKHNLKSNQFPIESFSSLPELYRAAVLHDEAEHDQSPTADVCTVTKEVFMYINFILLAGNILLFCFGFSVLYTHVAAYAASIGLSVTQRNNIFSALGISNMFGRILLGFIGKYLLLMFTNIKRTSRDIRGYFRYREQYIAADVNDILECTLLFLLIWFIAKISLFNDE